MLTTGQAGHLKVLKRYLRESGISLRLASRVEMNAQHVIANRQQNVPESEVELLQLVSEPLRVELHLEIYSPVLSCHPLLRLLQAESPAAMRQLCHAAVTQVALSRDDVLFSAGEVPSCPAVLFVSNGLLHYRRELGRAQDFGPGLWACEHVLWTEWAYYGQLKAVGACQIVMLEAEKFQQIATQHPLLVSPDPEGGLSLMRYAARFVERLNDEGCEASRSDLGCLATAEALLGNLEATRDSEVAPAKGFMAGANWALYKFGRASNRSRSTSSFLPSDRGSHAGHARSSNAFPS